MAVASPAILVGNAPPVRFNFAQTRQKVRLQVRFFSSTTAEVGAEITKGLGTRNLTVSAHSVVAEPIDTENAYVNESLESGFVNGTQLAVPGGTWAEFEFVEGSTNMTVVAPVATNPGGALAYRVLATVRATEVEVL